MTVCRSKQRKTQTYPLTTEVGNALLRYLKEVRPRSTQRELFVTLRRPYRLVSVGALSTMTRKLQKRLGLKLKRYGSHVLRHACATPAEDQHGEEQKTSRPKRIADLSDGVRRHRLNKGETLLDGHVTKTEASNGKSGSWDRQSGSTDGGKKKSTGSWCTAKPRLGTSRNTRPNLRHTQ